MGKVTITFGEKKMSGKEDGFRRRSFFSHVHTAELNELKRVSVYWCVNHKLWSLVAVTFFKKVRCCIESFACTRQYSAGNSHSAPL